MLVHEVVPLGGAVRYAEAQDERLTGIDATRDLLRRKAIAAAVVLERVAAGLRIEVLREYPYANGWKPFRAMQSLPGNRWTLAPEQPALPLMYSVVARKP